MNPWDIPLLLNNAASRAGQVVCCVFPAAVVFWFCVCRMGMV